MLNFWTKGCSVFFRRELQIEEYCVVWLQWETRTVTNVGKSSFIKVFVCAVENFIVC